MVEMSHLNNNDKEKLTGGNLASYFLFFEGIVLFIYLNENEGINS